jgi:hypothetical protein
MKKPWSEADIADLKAGIAHGAPRLKKLRDFCAALEHRFEAARKAKELGLCWQRGGHKRKSR